jgi:hypothetical protein
VPPIIGGKGRTLGKPHEIKLKTINNMVKMHMLIIKDESNILILAF